MSSLKHGIIVAVIGFVATYGVTLLNLIPRSISELTVGSLLAGIVAMIAHYKTA